MENEVTRFQRVSQAVQKNLFPENPQNVTEDFFKGKLKTFLICLAVSEKFKLKFTNEKTTFSEYALHNIYQALQNSPRLEEFFLLMSTLSDILKMPYEIKENIRQICLDMFPSVVEILRTQASFRDMAYDWARIVHVKDLLKMLESFEDYKKK